MAVRFADRVVDFDRLEILGPDGPVAVQPQVFDFIRYLIDHRDRVVPHAELLDELWGDRFVSDSAITSRVKHARRVLGDDGITQAVIRTVQGRGYRFVAELDADAPEGRATDEPAQEPPPTPASAPASTSTRSTPVDDDWPFVGRAEAVHDVLTVVGSPDGAAVLVEGGDRIGRSRFLRVVGRQLGDLGLDVIVVEPGAPDAPLSSLLGVVSADVFAAVAYESELARAQLFQLAVTDLQNPPGERRRVFVVDDADHVDGMTQAVLAQLLSDGSVSGVVTQRSGTTSRFAELADAGLLRRVRLGPLDEADVDVVVYRHLKAPLDRSSLRRLWELSGGVPGVLRDIVDTSRRAGALTAVDGVWRFTSDPRSSASGQWPVEGLSDGAVHMAEQLALLRRIVLDDLHDVAGDDQLDELDAAGLLALDDVDGDHVLSLADELLRATILESMPPLRRHRVRSELAEQLADSPRSDVLASVVEWGDEHAVRVDPFRRLLGAVDALGKGDLRSAELLVDSLSFDDWPSAAVLKAEIDVQHGRHEHAEAVLDSIDLGRLDDVSRGLAIRRRASIEFGVHQRHAESLDWLHEQRLVAEGGTAASLAARHIALSTYLGRYRQVLRDAGELAGVDGDVDLDALRSSSLRGGTRLEVMLSCASAFSALGRFTESLGAVDDADDHLDGLPPAWRVEPADHALMLRIGALSNLGRIDEANDIVDRHIPPGRVTSFGILPSIGAEAQLAAGRPRAARETMRPATSASASQAFPQYVGLNAAMLARCQQAAGAPWEAHAEAAVEHLAASSGGLRRRMACQLAEMLAELDEAPADLVALIEENAHDATEVGAMLGEMELTCALVSIDPTPATARRYVARVVEVAGAGSSAFDGELWPIRVAHVRARADGTSLDRVEADYRRLGYVLWANRAARGR